MVRVLTDHNLKLLQQVIQKSEVLFISTWYSYHHVRILLTFVNIMSAGNSL